jgi:hypothetical protein
VPLPYPDFLGGCRQETEAICDAAAFIAAGSDDQAAVVVL